MSRSLKKGPYVEESLLRKVEKMQASGKKQPIKTWSRRSMVLPDFVIRSSCGSCRIRPSFL